MTPPVLEPFEAYCLSITPVGSRVTCNPPPTDTDWDFLVLVDSSGRAQAALPDLGFVTTTSADYPSTFSSWRRGEINLLVTSDEDFHRAFLAATHVAKTLNLQLKADRVLLFQAVLYRNCAR